VAGRRGLAPDSCAVLSQSHTAAQVEASVFVAFVREVKRIAPSVAIFLLTEITEWFFEKQALASGVTAVFL
jgi:hypothetical protein